MKENKIKIILIFGVCFILGLIISLQLKAINENEIDDKNITVLQQKLLDYSQKIEDQSVRNIALNKYNAQLEKELAEGSISSDALLNEKEDIARFAGLRDVENSGFIIKVGFSKEAEMTDSLLRFIVNELRNIGAQALSVNEERLVATSEIRSTNDAIVINGKAFPLKDTFEIKAITEPKQEDYIEHYLNDNLFADMMRKPSNKDAGLQLIAMPEKNVKIPRLSEDSLAYKTNLLQVSENLVKDNSNKK